MCLVIHPFCLNLITTQPPKRPLSERDKPFGGFLLPRPFCLTNELTSAAGQVTIYAIKLLKLL